MVSLTIQAGGKIMDRRSIKSAVFAAVFGAMAMLASASHAQAPPPAAAGARRPPTPPAPPATNLTGSWVYSAKPDASPLILKLKQDGAVITGEMVSARPLAGLPPIILHGMIEGSQVDIMSWFDFDGGESAHLRGEFKDGHLIVQRSSVHSSARKWRLDTTVDEDYVQAH
jgi:hypothetical protein